MAGAGMKRGLKQNAVGMGQERRETIQGQVGKGTKKICVWGVNGDKVLSACLSPSLGSISLYLGVFRSDAEENGTRVT